MARFIPDRFDNRSEILIFEPCQLKSERDFFWRWGGLCREDQRVMVRHLPGKFVDKDSWKDGFLVFVD